MADSMFPEGTGRPKAVAKAGSPAQLTNGLIVDAKEAVDALWGKPFPDWKDGSLQRSLAEVLAAPATAAPNLN